MDYVVYTDFDYGPNSILTPEGYKNISELEVGDQVIVTGTWLQRSPKGFARTEGLLVYGALVQAGAIP